MTEKQKRAFWLQFAAACRNLGIPTEDRDDYRKAVILEEAKANHLAEVNNTDGFEAVMQRLAADAGEWDRAASFTAGNARRIGAMVVDCTRQVFELAGTSGDPEAYAQGILRQAGLDRAGVLSGDCWYLDYPEATPVKVFQILDSHRRRLLWRKRRETGRDVSMSYSFGVTYKEG